MTTSLALHAPARLDVVDARAIMRRHARSFSWAAPFLPRDARDDAAIAYAFCRTVDDLADDARDVAAIARARAQLSAIRARLIDARTPCNHAAIVDAYLDVATRRTIDATAAIELVDGALSDLAFAQPDDEAALLRYCHAVAGTVGLMMCGILGAHDDAARSPATALGIAMQLTNIARDVAEDAIRGRTYLPRAWLVDGDPWRAVLRCLDRADDFYRDAEAGLRFLPWRARLGVVVAGRLYRAIGVEVRRLGPRALTDRAVVSRTKKAWLVVTSLASVLLRASFGVVRQGNR